MHALLAALVLPGCLQEAPIASEAGCDPGSDQVGVLVLDPSGPAAGIVVGMSWTPPDTPYLRKNTDKVTDGAGCVRFGFLGEGSYLFTTQANECLRGQLQKKWDGGPLRFTLERACPPPPDGPCAHLAAVDRSRLLVHVYDYRGRWAGKEVTVTYRAGSEEARLVGTAFTDEDGCTSFPFVGVGDYTISVPATACEGWDGKQTQSWDGSSHYDLGVSTPRVHGRNPQPCEEP